MVFVLLLRNVKVKLDEISLDFRFRFLVIIYPLKCRFYLRNWHIYATLAFIWFYSTLLESSDFFTLRSFLFSCEFYFKKRFQNRFLANPTNCMLLLIVEMVGRSIVFRSYLLDAKVFTRKNSRGVKGFCQQNAKA